MIDKIDPSLRTDPLKESPTLTQTVDRVAAELGVARNTVFPTIGYATEHGVSHAIDRMVLNLLYVAAKIVADQNSMAF